MNAESSIADPPASDFGAASCGPAYLGLRRGKLRTRLPRTSARQVADCEHLITHHATRITGGFTMIEIAISLAVIGFALVAIVGILPLGMQTQKQNRQETVINQDESVFMNAIRNGEHALDDLTNYVIAITNTSTTFGSATGKLGSTHVYGYTYAGSSVDGAAANPSVYLTNGLRIVGLLSTPKYIVLSGGAQWSFISNHVVAYVRSISGNAAEKAPTSYAANRPVQDLVFDIGFNYRMVSDVIPYFAYDANGLAAGLPVGVVPGTPVGAPGTNVDYFRFTDNLQTNLHDLRLTFRWPLLASGDAGPGRQVFRAAAGGYLQATNEPGFGTPGSPWSSTLFFFNPRSYQQVPIP